jgi:hypothetical protein
MKKLSLLLCALMIAGVTFAGDGGKDKKCCKKDAKKECCKKGEKKGCDKDSKAEDKKAS